MPASYALLTLQEAQEYLGNPADTAVLDALIDDITLALEAWAQTFFVQRQTSEDYERPAGAELWLRRSPVVSVTSITDPAGNSVAATDYAVIKPRGLLRRPGGWPVPVDANGHEAVWTVTYTAGRWADTAAVPANVRLGAKLFVAERYLKRQPGVVREVVQGVGDVSYAGLVTRQYPEIPPEVAQLLAPYRSRGL